MEDKDIFLKAIEAYQLDTRPFELRFLNDFKGIYSGYFNDIDIAYDVIGRYWKDKTCYFTLQEINSSIVARSENRMGISRSVTSDKDIVNYRFVHVDIDPVRPSGIQASEEEVGNAYKRAREIRNFLQSTADFPKPLLVFSGNGTTLDYKLDRPISVSKTNIRLVKDFLETLSILFSDDKADVDTTVYNPSRIIKLPGTISAKGSDTDERPHRYSEILDVGDDIGISISQLKEIAMIRKDVGL